MLQISKMVTLQFMLNCTWNIIWRRSTNGNGLASRSRADAFREAFDLASEKREDKSDLREMSNHQPGIIISDISISVAR